MPDWRSMRHQHSSRKNGSANKHENGYSSAQFVTERARDDRPMALKKSELYSSLWASCDELRGGMDASQYKDYVLVLLFMKYVSDKAASQKG